MSARLAAVLAVVALLAGCTGEGGTSSSPGGSPSPTVSEPGPPPAAEPPPRPPQRGACHRMSYDEAVSPTASNRRVSCARGHTAETYRVGALDTVVDGRLLAVDSDRVQDQVATACPRQLPGLVGGTEEQRRLSMIRPVWFTPTVDQSDAGAGWYRCDVVVLAHEGTLLSLTGSLAGVLDTEAGRKRYGVCGTAEPGTTGFRRVVCAHPHSWRAIRTVPLGGGDYPGEAEARAAGEQPCRDAAEAIAPDPLDYRWGYEWPQPEQWRAGRTWGLCWAPD